MNKRDYKTTTVGRLTKWANFANLRSQHLTFVETLGGVFSGIGKSLTKADGFANLKAQHLAWLIPREVLCLKGQK